MSFTRYYWLVEGEWRCAKKLAVLWGCSYETALVRAGRGYQRKSWKDLK